MIEPRGQLAAQKPQFIHMLISVLGFTLRMSIPVSYTHLYDKLYDTPTYADPVQMCDGIEYVIVAGQVVYLSLIHISTYNLEFANAICYILVFAILIFQIVANNISNSVNKRLGSGKNA